MYKYLSLVFILFSSAMCFAQDHPTTLKFATFNVSMEADNYVPRGTQDLSEQILIRELATGDNQQIKNIAKIIQTVRPDIILLNEFDYIADPNQGILQFIKGYLEKPQGTSEAITYPYYYCGTVNTGQPTPYDLDNNGKYEQFGSDAWGFGKYPGQYGMVVLSRFPILVDQVRTFQNFKWKDMPGFLPTTKADGSNWYEAAAWEQFPLSSKSHWDLPVKVGKKTIHVLASHPTPPTFDGTEDRNGKRNHDEIRFWNDYISGKNNSYIYDDKGSKGGLPKNESFVIMGDQNASPVEGDALGDGIRSLVSNPKIIQGFVPESAGGSAHSPANLNAKNHTAFWRMRADYVLPSQAGFKILDGGVFWPAKGEANAELVEKREASSDHRMVWVKVAFTKK